MVLADLNHRGQDVVPGLLPQHDLVGVHAAVPADVFDFRCSDEEAILAFSVIRVAVSRCSPDRVVGVAVGPAHEAVANHADAKRCLRHGFGYALGLIE